GVAAPCCPVGSGAYVQWDRRLDGRIAQALCAIQAIKGVEFGLGFETARRPGSQVHDEILLDAQGGFRRASNNAGGLEGGVTNGQPVVVRAAMKPLSTLRTPLRSVDVATKEAVEAVVERSDVSAVPAAGVVGEAMLALGVGSRAVLVSDDSVLRLHGEAVTQSLRTAGFSLSQVVVPEGERAKSITVAQRGWDELLAAGIDRTSTVVALGGGAVGDLAGFVAATYMRGLNFVQLPTTILAQLDASIGGKTALDHPRAKNLIGAFHQPRLVLVDPDVVVTLSDREFRSGLAEVVKHGIVADEAYFVDVERHAGALLARDLPPLERVIAGSCRIKASIVERDEQE